MSNVALYSRYVAFQLCKKRPWLSQLLTEELSLMIQSIFSPFKPVFAGRNLVSLGHRWGARAKRPLNQGSASALLSLRLTSAGFAPRISIWSRPAGVMPPFRAHLKVPIWGISCESKPMMCAATISVGRGWVPAIIKFIFVTVPGMGVYVWDSWSSFSLLS